MNRVTLYSRKILKSATPFCTGLIKILDFSVNNKNFVESSSKKQFYKSQVLKCLTTEDGIYNPKTNLVLQILLKSIWFNESNRFSYKNII